jgi:cell division protein FtsW (lipid II flippase)
MPKKSIWESNSWKTVIAISVILTIIASFLTILQLLGTVDVYNLLLLPIINFFTIPIPLYSIPLAFLVVLVIILVLAYASSGSVTISNPFDRADILDDDCVRYVAVLCQTPRTADFLRQKYQEFRELHGYRGGYSSDELLKELEDRGLLIFQNAKWEVTQKALDYIEKYHGG